MYIYNSIYFCTILLQVLCQKPLVSCQTDSLSYKYWHSFYARKLHHSRQNPTKMVRIWLHTSVNINASYIEALLCKKLIRSKIYFLCIFFLNRPSYIDVFQQICFSYFLVGLSQTRSTPIIIDKDEINLFYIFIFFCT
jgi:hypothetical protein